MTTGTNGNNIFSTLAHAGVDEDLQTLYNALWNEFSYINMIWKEYTDLFGTIPDRVDLINKIAPTFFNLLQNIYWEMIILKLCSITDKRITLKKSNLTILALPDFVKDNVLKEKLADLIEKAKNETAFCRDWRNRHIAHKDLSLIIDKNATPLQKASIKDINDAISSISSVLNLIQKKYFHSETPFSEIWYNKGATSLLQALSRNV